MSAIVAEARNWLGVRFQHQGRNRAGVDCIGFIGAVAQALGVPEAAAWRADPEGMGYGREPEAGKLLALCERYLARRPLDSRLPGDILLLIVPPSPQPRHFALVSSIDPLYVIHAFAPARRVVEHRLPDALARGVVAVWGFRGAH